jgi:hypothetical protein
LRPAAEDLEERVEDFTFRFSWFGGGELFIR